MLGFPSMMGITCDGEILLGADIFANIVFVRGNNIIYNIIIYYYNNTIMSYSNKCWGWWKQHIIHGRSLMFFVRGANSAQGRRKRAFVL